MELSKEPDPDGHSTAMAKLLESLYTMRIEVLVNSPCSIRHLARCAKQTKVFGALYRTWDENDDNADKWTFACTGYEESYSDYPDDKTWEERVLRFSKCATTSTMPLKSGWKTCWIPGSRRRFASI